MKATPFTLDWKSTIFVVIVILTFCDARPHNSHRHHGALNARDVREPLASSGSSLALSANGGGDYGASGDFIEDRSTNVSIGSWDQSSTRTLGLLPTPASQSYQFSISIQGVPSTVVHETYFTATTIALQAPPAAVNSCNAGGINTLATPVADPADPVSTSASVISARAAASPTGSSSGSDDDGYGGFLGGFSNPTSSSSASSSVPTSPCPAGNGTGYTSTAGKKYKVICNTDFPGHDFAFQLVNSFEECVQKCDDINTSVGGCLATLFLPSRVDGANDCYLKSNIQVSEPSTLEIDGAILIQDSQSSASTSTSSPTPGTSTSSSALVLSTYSASNSGSTLSSASVLSTFSAASSTLTSSSTSTSSIVSSSSSALSSGSVSSSSSISSSSSASSANSLSVSSSVSASSAGSSSILVSTPSSSSVATQSTTVSIAYGPSPTYASGTLIIAPTMASSQSHGPSENHPTTQYIDYTSPVDLTLSANLLTVGVNGQLSIAYGLSLDTGCLEINSSTQSLIADLTDTPHISRDGGKGGFVNGQHLFVFCDTGAYTTTTSTLNGDFLGFVSSSVAIDIGMNGIDGKALYLQDGIGQWSDNVGRMRGFSPLTQGEQSYNLAMQGQGQRYAIWPESSIIPLDAETGLMYAPIVYDDINESTKAAVFTYTGATALTITAGGEGGPVAQRVNDRIFMQNEVEWGCLGGIRSWGSSGIGGTDGYVYIFGNVPGGILLARTAHGSVADPTSFNYWTGNSWSSDMIPSSSTAYFISGAFMDVDLFYSPRHLTFVIVYMTIYADNTFYYRYLQANSSILPPFASGGDPASDYVENVLKYNWSAEQVLFKTPPTESGRYVYAGGVHQGYFGSNDIVNGGSKMLLSWTAPTGKDPSSEDSEYQIMTAEVDWD